MVQVVWNFLGNYRVENCAVFATEDALIPFLFDFFPPKFGRCQECEKVSSTYKGDGKPISGKMQSSTMADEMDEQYKPNRKRLIFYLVFS